MSTSDQPESTPLTRKQLREIRLTGATTVITPEQAAAAASPPVPVPPPAVVETAPAEQTETETGPVAEDGTAPLTRRQVREAERVRTASVPVVASEPDQVDGELVSGVPTFNRTDAGTAANIDDDVAATIDDDSDLDEDEGQSVDIAPVSAAAAVEPVAVQDVVAEPVDAEPVAEESVAEESVVEEPVAEEPVVEAPVVEELVVDEPAASGTVVDEPAVDEPSGDEAADDADDDELPVDERPVVSPAFGEGVLSEAADVPTFAPSFDDLISSDSNGSQHVSPSTLIFTPSPGDGSLSGPVASTGEILVTGSYELPQGIGSQGHAPGVADGKDVDSVLIDGELPPASSPTPIAASAAISTIKPAGEVIRPPAPEKGNRLMLVLAITAGGLALVLAAALIVAFTTNVLS